MVVVIFIGASLLAFGLSFWLTRWLQRPRQAGDQGSQAGWQGRSPQNGSQNGVISPSSPSPLASSSAPDLDRQVRDLLGQGRLIDAVKRVREVNGCSLSDAKAYVEERLP